jgi:hypothetical protein
MNRRGFLAPLVLLGAALLPIGAVLLPLGVVLLPLGVMLLPQMARAEFRAYELEVVDVLDCRLNKRAQCKSAKITTAVSPDLYVQTNGGDDRINAVVIATWMCYGDTSEYREICPRPGPRSPKFNPGDDVRVTLKKHITEGWKGTVEVVYRDDFLGANVVGVRFAERKNVYARYFEKDLMKADGGTGASAGTGAATPQQEPPK